jgi:hypothetical protein
MYRSTRRCPSGSIGAYSNHMRDGKRVMNSEWRATAIRWKVEVEEMWEMASNRWRVITSHLEVQMGERNAFEIVTVRRNY